MKKHANLKRLFSLVLTVAMALSLAAPGFAANGGTRPLSKDENGKNIPPYEVNIEPNDNTARPEKITDLESKLQGEAKAWVAANGETIGADGDYANDAEAYSAWLATSPYGTTYTGNYGSINALATAIHNAQVNEMGERFVAYQIFAGNIDPDDWVADKEPPSTGYYPDGGDNPETGYYDPHANWLSTITWGDSITKTEIVGLLCDLMNDTTPAKDVGVTGALLAKAAVRYENLLQNYLAEYNESSNWTSGIVGGTMTEDGAGAIDAAMAQDLESITLGQLFWAALDHAGYEIDDESPDATDIKGMDNPGRGDDEAASNGFLDLQGTARVIAQVLTDFTPARESSDPNFNNAALAERFAKIVDGPEDEVGKYLMGNPSDTTDNGVVETSRWCDTHNQWELGYSQSSNGIILGGKNHVPTAGHNGQLKGGYYIIKDTYEDGDGDYVVGVFGDTNIKVKSGTPEVDKKIKNKDNGNENGDDFETGKKVTFELDGTLPANYINYDWYYYAFHDTMSKGVTFDGYDTVHVWMTIKNPKYVQDSANIWEQEYLTIDITDLMSENHDYDRSAGNVNPEDGKYFYVHSEKDGTDGTTKLDIVFPNLKEFNITDTDGDFDLHAQLEALFTTEDVPGSTYTTQIDAIIAALEAMNNWGITKDTTFHIEYDAHLNADAIVTGANTNKVELEYSNNPKDGGKGDTDTTPDDEVYVYDFGLDIFKYDGATTDDPLEAGFAVTKNTADATTVKQYAITQSSDNDGGPEANWTWVTAAELQTTDEVIDALTYKTNANSRRIGTMISGVTYQGSGTDWRFVFNGVQANSSKVKTRNREIPPVYEYAILAQVELLDEYGESLVPAEYKYVIAGWIPESAVAGLLGAASLDAVTDTQWKTPLDYTAIGTYIGEWIAHESTDGGETTNYERDYAYYLCAMTTKEGALRVEGMESDTYFLKEVVTPYGYDTIEDIEVTYEATYYGDSVETGAPAGTKPGMIKDLIVSYSYTDFSGQKQTVTGVTLIKDGYWCKWDPQANNGNGGYVKTTMPAWSNNDPNGDLPLFDQVLYINVPNYPQGFLPGTGGMGTTLFYIAGAVMVLGAAAFLFFSLKGKKEEESL